MSCLGGCLTFVVLYGIANSNFSHLVAAEFCAVMSYMLVRGYMVCAAGVSCLGCRASA